MRHFIVFLTLAVVLSDTCALAQEAARPPAHSVAEEPYVPSADSQAQPGVAKGKIFEFILDRSNVFPGTRRTIQVYVPAQYRADRPACVYVGLDGLLFEAPVVLDNLIHRNELPVMIAIGVQPGTVDSVSAPDNPRFNRSAEFDGLNGNLARFLLDEVLPEVERRKTPDGLPIVLSKDPSDRAVAGSSSSGIAAFTLAWERPDAFRRVFSAIGTFVGMRGGDRYPGLVRKTEPKPIRVFLQDGLQDQWLGGPEMGDWWMANQTMERALSFAGYAVEHVWGQGRHNIEHATAVFPDAMRWLWKEWPQPVNAGVSQNTVLQAILMPGETWQSVPADDRYAIALLADATRYRVKDFKGREYSSDAISGKIWLRDPRGRKVLLDSGLKGPTGIALSPDGLWLAVAESNTHFGYSYRVEADGTIRYKQRFYWFHVPDDADGSGAGPWAADRDGRLYAATRMGVQVFDRNGRARAVLTVPGGEVTALSFGGEAFDTLYVRCTDGHVYRRKLKVPSLAPGSAPVRPAQASAG